MGFAQTNGHQSGAHSHHQIGLVLGQFGDHLREGDKGLLPWLQETGFDGYEEASWGLELKRCDTEEDAEMYANELVKTADEYKLKIFSLAVHLQGQALGDEPSLKTLQFIGGQAYDAYVFWRDDGNKPPEADPYYVPEHVGRLIHEQATKDLIRSVRLAYYLGKVQNRIVPLSGFVGSPAHCWSHFFEFPPPVGQIEGYTIPDPRKISLDIMVERFKPVWNLCKDLKVPFGLECHPSERAMGDLASAREYLDAVIAAGYEGVVGFNFDASHMLWQGVNPIEFIREFGEHIFSVHLKGVWVSDQPTRHGLLGGHQPMGNPRNGWIFVTAGSDRDSLNEQEIIIALNQAGFDGALSIEWEDSDINDLAGAALALSRISAIDLSPSDKRHDETLKA